MTGARKLVVEVISAKDLMPKDGHGSSNAYCVVRALFFGLVGACETFTGLEKGNQVRVKMWMILIGFIGCVRSFALEFRHLLCRSMSPSVFGGNCD